MKREIPNQISCSQIAALNRANKRVTTAKNAKLVIYRQPKVHCKKTLRFSDVL